MKTESVLEYVLVNYRWVFVCFFLLPSTLCYEIFFHIRHWFVFYAKRAPKVHEVKVEFVQDQVKEWKRSQLAVPMCTARPGWKSMTFREPKYKKTMYKIEVDLGDILEIDTQKQTVRVEPRLTIGQLSATLNPLGWTIPILIDMEDVTIGGAVMGQGVESGSHIHGLFQNSCISYELVVADGSVITCSKDEDPDLFFSIPWSYGSLGFLTAVELKMIPAKRFVELKYEPVRSLDEVVQVFSREVNKSSGNQFVEGLMFSKEEGVVMTGNMVDRAPQNVNEIGRWYKPWFFEHVRTFMKTGIGFEYIPLRDYYLRHSKSIFWELQEIVPFGNEPWFRFLFGWLMPPKVSFLKLTQTQTIRNMYDKNHVVQDFLLPLNTMKESISMFDEKLRIYPLWLCAFKLANEPGLVHSFSDKDEMYVDFGLYGTPKRSYDPVETIKDIERYAANAKGFHMLTTGTYATREEFEERYDHSLYCRVRKRFQCDGAFPDIYDKVNRKVRD